MLLAHVAATLFMTGVAWFVQIVHYPLLHRVGASGFGRYEAEHARRTSPLVAPVMILELATGLLLVLRPPDGIDARLLWINAALLAVIWTSTLAVQGPAHRELAGGYREAAVARLVTGNWVRTLAWTARAGLLLLGLGAAQTAPLEPPVPAVPILTDPGPTAS